MSVPMKKCRGFVAARPPDRLLDQRPLHVRHQAAEIHATEAARHPAPWHTHGPWCKCARRLEPPDAVARAKPLRMAGGGDLLARALLEPGSHQRAVYPDSLQGSARRLPGASGGAVRPDGGGRLLRRLLPQGLFLGVDVVVEAIFVVLDRRRPI